MRKCYLKYFSLRGNLHNGKLLVVMVTLYFLNYIIEKIRMQIKQLWVNLNSRVSINLLKEQFKMKLKIEAWNIFMLVVFQMMSQVTRQRANIKSDFFVKSMLGKRYGEKRNCHEKEITEHSQLCVVEILKPEIPCC